MTRNRNHDSDIFARRPVLQVRERLDKRTIEAEADIAGSEAFMEATVAAGMIVAHADGYASIAEHRRVIALLKAHPILSAFSVDDISQEIEQHVSGFAIDHSAASARAFGVIRNASLTAGQFDTLIRLCDEVVRADAVTERSEVQALTRIGALHPAITG